MQIANNKYGMAIKFTKNQILILEIFFNNPEKSYYLRELGRMLSKQPGVFQREINKLTKDNFLISEYQASSRYFKLNKNHPLFNELKSIFFKTLGAEGRLKGLLVKVKNIETAFIYGSFAKNKEDQFSDIDLMIIGAPDEDILISKISKIEGEIGREINYTIFSPQDLKNGLTKKEVFLEDIIKGPKIFIIGDQYVLEKIIRK